MKRRNERRRRTRYMRKIANTCHRLRLMTLSFYADEPEKKTAEVQYLKEYNEFDVMIRYKVNGRTKGWMSYGIQPDDVEDPYPSKST